MEKTNTETGPVTRGHLQVSASATWSIFGQVAFCSSDCENRFVLRDNKKKQHETGSVMHTLVLMAEIWENQLSLVVFFPIV